MASQRVRHDWATELNWTVCGKASCLPHYPNLELPCTVLWARNNPLLGWVTKRLPLFVSAAQPPLMNTFSTDFPIRLKACSGKGSQSALSSLLCISFPTLSSADPLWFLTPLGWAQEERGQKPERSYLTEMVVNCFFCPHCFGMRSKLTLCGLLLWAVLKSFCFSLQM